MVWYDPLANILKLFHNKEVSIKVKGSNQNFTPEIVSSFIKSDAGIMTSSCKENQIITKDTLNPIFFIIINYTDNDPVLENACARKKNIANFWSVHLSKLEWTNYLSNMMKSF